MRGHIFDHDPYVAFDFIFLAARVLILQCYCCIKCLPCHSAGHCLHQYGVVIFCLSYFFQLHLMQAHCLQNMFAEAGVLAEHAARTYLTLMSRLSEGGIDPGRSDADVSLPIDSNSFVNMAFSRREAATSALTSRLEQYRAEHVIGNVLELSLPALMARLPQVPCAAVQQQQPQQSGEESFAPAS